MFGIDSNNFLNQLFSIDKIDFLKTKSISVEKNGKHVNEALVNNIKKYLIDNDVTVYEKPAESDLILSIAISIVTPEENQQELNQRNKNIQRITVKAIDIETHKIEFISTSEMLTNQKRTESGIGFKWYEPVIITLAVASLIFGLWSLD